MKGERQRPHRKRWRRRLALPGASAWLTGRRIGAWLREVGRNVRDLNNNLINRRNVIGDVLGL